MDGIYETSINTPMGPMNARIYLKTNGNNLTGMIEMMGMKNEINGGKVEGNKCFMKGNLKNNMLSLQYNIIAELIGNKLNIYAKTNMGEFQLQENKIK